MSVPQALRANYTDLFGSAMLPVLEEMFRSEYNRHPMRRDVLFQKKTTDRDIWQYTEMHDMPLFAAVSEGEDYTFSRPKQGYDKTLTVLKYGLGFSISEEAVSDGKFDHMADAVKKMAKSAFESQEQAAMNIINNGFSSETTGDGQALFATAHTTPTGTYTIRNVLSSAADLSATSLATAMSDFEKNFVGDSGIKYMIRPKYLVVPSELRFEAKKIVNSDLLPGSPNNDLNPMKDEGLIIISSPHITDTDSFYLISAPEDHGLRIVSRKPVETKYAGEDVGFLNDSLFVKSRFREVLAAVHPYGVFGTPGTG
jgi:hypothetical protein